MAGSGGFACDASDLGAAASLACGAAYGGLGSGA